jgi:hypothetical protein
MTNRTEDHEIEDRLRQTLHAVAATTTVHDDLLAGPADVIPFEPQRTRRPYWLIGVAAAVALTAGVAAVLVSRDTTEQTVPPATDSMTPVTTPAPPPSEFSRTPESGRHAVLGTVAPLVWLENEENEADASMAIRVERWVDGDREVTVIIGADNLANLPCDDVCSVGGSTAVYQRGLTQAEVDAIAADPTTLRNGPFRLAEESSVWPEAANTAAIWGESVPTGPGASVSIVSFPGVALNFAALEGLPMERIEIGGRPALYVTGLFQDRDAAEGGVQSADALVHDAVIWSPTDEVAVAVLAEGFNRDERIAFANNVVLVGDSAWADLVARPTDRDPRDPLGGGDQGSITVAAGEAGDWELVTYQGGGLDTGVSDCYELFGPTMLWQNCGWLRLAVGPIGDRAVVAGSMSPAGTPVRLTTSGGQTIEPQLVDTPYGNPMFVAELPQELGPLTIEWLGSDGTVAKSETVALDQPMVGG